MIRTTIINNSMMNFKDLNLLGEDKVKGES